MITGERSADTHLWGGERERSADTHLWGAGAKRRHPSLGRGGKRRHPSLGSETQTSFGLPRGEGETKTPTFWPTTLSGQPAKSSGRNADTHLFGFCDERRQPIYLESRARNAEEGNADTHLLAFCDEGRHPPCPASVRDRETQTPTFWPSVRKTSTLSGQRAGQGNADTHLLAFCKEDIHLVRPACDGSGPTLLALGRARRIRQPLLT